MNVNLWKLPKSGHDEIKEAYENGEWFWLIKQWNDFQVTADKLCSTCPKSIKIIKEHIPKLWKD